VATIDARSVTLAVRVPSSQPTVTPDPGPPVGFKFDSPTIDADASMRLTETTRESVANWTLGFSSSNTSASTTRATAAPRFVTAAPWFRTATKFSVGTLTSVRPKSGMTA
jgi:hypothetical protein